jgi:hypothetical protein
VKEESFDKFQKLAVDVGFKEVTVLVMKSTVIWDITSCKGKDIRVTGHGGP